MINEILESTKAMESDDAYVLNSRFFGIYIFYKIYFMILRCNIEMHRNMHFKMLKNAMGKVSIFLRSYGTFSTMEHFFACIIITMLILHYTQTYRIFFRMMSVKQNIIYAHFYFS